MNDALAAEVSRVAVGIGHIVAMGQEYLGDSAEIGEPLNQPWYELGRVDEPVAGWVMDEVAAAAVRLWRFVPAVIDRILDQHGEVIHDLLRPLAAAGANRAGRATH